MSYTYRWFTAAALTCCLLLAGCATSRSEIKLSTPSASEAVAAPVDGKLVVIRSISDDRVFEEKPKDPSTPSLGFGGAQAAPADVKARAIGRKRNTYGKALGDILLENGQTVEGVVRENLTLALQQAGYRVQGDDTSGDALPIDVHIKQFWAWFQPGFWAITLHAKISTEISAGGASAPITIEIHAEDKRQMATDTAWMEIIDQALKEYRAAASIQTRDKL